MIVTCSQCTASLQIDERKATSERFSIRCPKCQNVIPVDLKNNAGAAFSLNSTNARNWEVTPAIEFQKPTSPNEEFASLLGNADLLPVLTAALQQQKTALTSANSNQPHKRVLLCLDEARRKATAELLDEAGYSVYLADNPAQATEKIRDAETDIVVYSPNFAAKFSGVSVLQQMLNSLTTNDRRKFFVVSVEESSQTFDTHEAFMRNLNLIVNSTDLHHLPSILNRALRDHTELYRFFNQALETV